jgi:hypothetical protein
LRLVPVLLCVLGQDVVRSLDVGEDGRPLGWRVVLAQLGYRSEVRVSVEGFGWKSR